MGLQAFWKNYKVLVVMGSSLALIHLGWYKLKAHPLLQRAAEPAVPEPAIVAFVSAPTATKSK